MRIIQAGAGMEHPMSTLDSAAPLSGTTPAKTTRLFATIQVSKVLENAHSYSSLMVVSA